MPKSQAADHPRSYFFKRMRKHFGVDPAELVLVSQAFPPYHRPNLHLALEKLLAMKGTAVELQGVILAEAYESVSVPVLLPVTVVKVLLLPADSVPFAATRVT